MLGKTGRLEEAIGHGRRATELDAGNPVPWSDFGYDLTRAGRFDEAAVVLERAVALDAEDATFARANLAHLEEVRGRHS